MQSIEISTSKRPMHSRWIASKFAYNCPYGTTRMFFSWNPRTVTKWICTSQECDHQFNPVLDQHHVIRVRGRLQNARLPYNQRHPMILPKNHQFTDLIIDHAHHITLHGGIQLTLAWLRKRFWIVHARKIITTRIKVCTICFKLKPKPTQQLMGNLPKQRVAVSARPFLATGVDYTGAIELKASRYRGNTTYKG